MTSSDPWSGDDTSIRQFAAALIAVAGVAFLFVPVIGLRSDAIAALNIGGIAVVAWLAGGRPAAALSVLWTIGRWGVAKDQGWDVAGTLGVQWGVTIGLIGGFSWLRHRLDAERRLARLDVLTGLPNRHAFFERCAAELSRARRFGRPVTLVVLDGDSFKAVNDQSGHATGDLALQATARCLRETVRQYDFVARLGGDEFVILLPETGAPEAEHAVERLQAALRARVERQFPPLTYSLGVLTYFPGDWSVTTCLSEADRVLYLAKRSGKGRVSFHVAGPS
jgi:diguanylate cyclase (GGDEF)-like protein